MPEKVVSTFGFILYCRSVVNLLLTLRDLLNQASLGSLIVLPQKILSVISLAVNCTYNVNLFSVGIVTVT